MSIEQEKISKVDLTFLKQLNLIDIFVYPLATLDFMTTTYGIATRGLDLQGPLAFVISIILAGIFLWVVLISKDRIAPAIEKRVVPLFRNLASKFVGIEWINLIGEAIAPTVVTVIGIVYIVVDFWTSLEGVSAIIPFKGTLGVVLKSFAVSALVLSTFYLIYLKPKQVD